MSRDKFSGCHENGVVISYQQIKPQTLRKLIQEFVTRDGADWGNAGCSLDEKCDQVLCQLKEKRVKIVFDLEAGTANIVVCR